MEERVWRHGEFILQEYVNGISLSSSLLATESKVKTIINTRLLSEHDYGIQDSFVYVGNILPLTSKSIMGKVKDIDKINAKMNDTTERLASKFNLIGSNGVDYILNENGLYIIEINPRIQGTFECVEKSQPLLTIIDKDTDFEKLYEKVELASEKVNSEAKKHQLGE